MILSFEIIAPFLQPNLQEKADTANGKIFPALINKYRVCAKSLNLPARNHQKDMFTFNCKGRLVQATEPMIMGIMNITPDSFYEGSRFQHPGIILRQAEKMIAEGVDIIDIGGQSTRPGAEMISAATEAERVIAVIRSIHQRFPDTLISIDTYHSRVAREAVEAGASFINDISAGSLDPDMFTVAASAKVPYVCMHMKGSPANMQTQASYEDVTREVLDFFVLQKEKCRLAGINDIIIDPGFGFAKSISHNFELLKNLEVFKVLGCPILLGISRKSTIYKTLNIQPADALNGTTVLHTFGLLQGADILRVHDVKEARQAIILLRELTR
jgi:dihydropteroate synthase